MKCSSTAIESAVICKNFCIHQPMSQKKYDNVWSSISQKWHQNAIFHSTSLSLGPQEVLFFFPRKVPIWSRNRHGIGDARTCICSGMELCYILLVCSRRCNTRNSIGNDRTIGRYLETVRWTAINNSSFIRWLLLVLRRLTCSSCFQFLNFYFLSQIAGFVFNSLKCFW